MLDAQRIRQYAIDAPISAGQGLRTRPLDDAQGRQDPAPLAQIFQRLSSQQQPLVSLLGKVGQFPHQGPEVVHAEGRQAEIGAQRSSWACLRRVTSRTL